MNKLKILNIVLGMSLGGAALFIKNLCRHSAHTHHILGIQKKWDVMHMDGIPYFECLSHDETSSLIRREAYNLIHWHWWQPLDLMHALAEKRLKIPSIITVHVYGSRPPYQLTAFEREFANHFIFVSPAAPALPENQSIPTERTSVINAGADLSPFLKLTPSIRKAFVIGRASALNRFKCPENLIDTFRRMRFPDATFLIAGDGELKEPLSSSLTSEMDRRRFQFLGFIVDMPSFYAGLDLYCYQLPTHSYAAAELNLQEAMAAALPIVFMPSPGARHLIEHGVTGFVADDEDALIRYAGILYEDSDLRYRLGQNARKASLKRFGIHNCVSAFDSVFEKVSRGSCSYPWMDDKENKDEQEMVYRYSG